MYYEFAMEEQQRYKESRLGNIINMTNISKQILSWKLHVILRGFDNIYGISYIVK